MGGMAFADDGADSLKRNAAQVPSRSSKVSLLMKMRVRVLNRLVDSH